MTSLTQLVPQYCPETQLFSHQMISIDKYRMPKKELRTLQHMYSGNLMIFSSFDISNNTICNDRQISPKLFEHSFNNYLLFERQLVLKSTKRQNGVYFVV